MGRVVTAGRVTIWKLRPDPGPRTHPLEVGVNMLPNVDFLPDGLVPIARASAKGVLFLDFRERPDNPSLVLLGGEPDFVSASFGEFMDSLFDEDA